MWWKQYFNLCGLPFKNPYPQSNHKKNIKQILRDTLQNNLTSSPQNVKVIKNKESLKTCPSQDEPKERYWLYVMWIPEQKKDSG